MPAQNFQIGVKGLIRDDDGRVLMVHIPPWSGNEAHWDLPGGRIDTGEQLLETLKRELIEEIGMPYIGTPRQLLAFVTKITILVGGVRLPLMFVVYETMVADPSKVKLDESSTESDFRWFTPKEAADKMKYKFSEEFCELVAKL